MIVLDTHALVFHAADPDQLSRRALRRIEEETARSAIWISSITAREIAMLVKKGRLRLKVPVEDWITRAESIPGLSTLAVDSTIAIRSVALPEEYPADPADRIIAATALCLGAELVTKDPKLRRIASLPTVW